MAKQSLKQQARRTVQEALAAKQKERAERDRRQGELAVEVVSALAERDEVAASCERVAAAAVRSLTGEGLTISDVAELCGEQVDVKELQRLARLESEPSKG